MLCSLENVVHRGIGPKWANRQLHQQPPVPLAMGKETQTVWSAATVAYPASATAWDTAWVVAVPVVVILPACKLTSTPITPGNAPTAAFTDETQCPQVIP